MSWMGLCQVVAVVLQFLGSVVLAWYLTPHEMGIYAVAAATVGLLSLIQAFGLQALVVREETLTDDVIRTAFTINTIISILLAISIATLSLVGGAALGDDRVRHVMLALSISPLFGIFDFLPGARLERAGRFKVLALAGIACGIVSAVVTIACAVAGARYMTAAYAGWASAATYAIIVNIVGRDYIQFRFGLDSWRRAASFGLLMLATSGLHSIGGRVSDICLSKLQGLSALGIYSRASNLNGLIWNNIHMAVGRVMFVDYAELHRQGISLRERYIATVDVITALLWPAFAGFATLAGPLILTIYGEKWVAAATPMAMLAISSMVLVSITMTWEIFTATGNLATQTRIEFYNAIFSTAAIIAGGYFSLTAAAASRIVSGLVAVAIYRPHLSRMTDTSSADFLPIYARSAALTALAVGPAMILMLSYGFSPAVPLLLVAGSAIAGMALWCLGLVLFRHRLVAEGRTLVGRFRRNDTPEMVVAGMGPYQIVESQTDR